MLTQVIGIHMQSEICEGICPDRHKSQIWIYFQRDLLSLTRAQRVLSHYLLLVPWYNTQFVHKRSQIWFLYIQSPIQPKYFYSMVTQII